MSYPFRLIIKAHDFVVKTAWMLGEVTEEARKALGLKGTKYSKELEGNATLPDGREVRLLPGHSSFNTSTHRLQIKCPRCTNWIPTGRFSQHILSCSKRNLPTFVETFKKYRPKITELAASAQQDEKNKKFHDAYEKWQVVADLYESIDPQIFERRINRTRNSAFISLARFIAIRQAESMNTFLSSLTAFNTNWNATIAFPLKFKIHLKDSVSGGVISIDRDGSYSIQQN